MRIAGVVILYHPELNSILKNISSYLSKLGTLYIADNTENPDPVLIKKIKALPDTVYLHDGENMGIAKRLNEVANKAKSKNYDWLLTMDQDSMFAENNLQNYLHCVNSFKEKEQVAMFGVEYDKKVCQHQSQGCLSIETNQLITSGSIVNLGIFHHLGGFDENLFIDEVDLEYCYRAIVKGFKIIKQKNIYLHHNLGDISYHRSLKNFKLTPRTLHSPIRIYYMTRNYYYLNEKYKSTFPRETTIRRKGLLNRIKNNLLYGNKRFTTIKYILKGYSDYRKKKMGKLIDN